MEKGGTKAYVPSPDSKAQNPHSRMLAGLRYYLFRGEQIHGKCATDSQYHTHGRYHSSLIDLSTLASLRYDSAQLKPIQGRHHKSIAAFFSPEPGHSHRILRYYFLTATPIELAHEL